jgi:phosphatidylserine decarboxylase
MPPASGSVARRRLFKKSSKDDYGTPGTPGGLLTPGLGTSGTATPGSISGLPPSTSRKRRPVFKRGKGKKGTAYTLDHPAQHDILGIVMLEIEGAVDLPKLRNCRCTPDFRDNH